MEDRQCVFLVPKTFCP